MNAVHLPLFESVDVGWIVVMVAVFSLVDDFSVPLIIIYYFVLISMR